MMIEDHFLKLSYFWLDLRAKYERGVTAVLQWGLWSSVEAVDLVIGSISVLTLASNFDVILQVLFTWKQKFPGRHPFVPPSHVAPPRFEWTTCGSGGMVSCTLKSQHNSCDLWLGKMIGMEINEISMELFAISVQYNMVWKSMWYYLKLLYL